MFERAVSSAASHRRLHNENRWCTCRVQASRYSCPDRLQISIDGDGAGAPHIQEIRQDEMRTEGEDRGQQERGYTAVVLGIRELKSSEMAKASGFYRRMGLHQFVTSASKERGVCWGGPSLSFVGNTTAAGWGGCAARAEGWRRKARRRNHRVVGELAAALNVCPRNPGCVTEQRVRPAFDRVFVRPLSRL